MRGPQDGLQLDAHTADISSPTTTTTTQDDQLAIVEVVKHLGEESAATSTSTADLPTSPQVVYCIPFGALIDLLDLRGRNLQYLFGLPAPSQVG